MHCALPVFRVSGFEPCGVTAYRWWRTVSACDDHLLRRMRADGEVDLPDPLIQCIRCSDRHRTVNTLAACIGRSANPVAMAAVATLRPMAVVA